MSKAVAIIKDLISVLRDAFLLLLAFLLVAFPTKLNSVLVNAGFEEGSIVGFKWKSSLVASDAALKEARVTIADLQKRNNELGKLLIQAKANPNDPSVKAAISRAEKDNLQLMESTRLVQASLSSTVASNAPLVERALAASEGNSWAIVWSGDATLEGAKYEVKDVAPRLGLPNPGIYFRQGSYRSVSVVGDKEVADRLLPKAKSRRQDAYLVNLKTWCVEHDQRDGYVSRRN